MFDFLQVQYKLGRLNDVQLLQYVAAGCISEASYQEIIGRKVL